MTYGPDHAELYDLVFRSRGKDFAAEADKVTTLIRERNPSAASLLDVACGTGAHLATLAERFDEVAGVELESPMIEVASSRLPGVPVHQGDMRVFDLGRTFDAVVCLGNAVSCMLSEADLDLAIARMAAHLDTGGVLVAEPWWFPHNFIDGYVGGHLVKQDGRVITRMTYSRREGGTTRMEIRFLIADSDGFHEINESLVTSLFTIEQYATAFERAGCTVEFLDAPLQLAGGRPNAPGLFIGVRK
jgi:SAM-dependent methyltransferase